MSKSYPYWNTSIPSPCFQENKAPNCQHGWDASDKFGPNFSGLISSHCEYQPQWLWGFSLLLLVLFVPFFVVLGRSPPASGALHMLLPLSSTLFSFLIPHHRNTATSASIFLRAHISDPQDYPRPLVMCSQSTQNISFITLITVLITFW